jgi:hypothetical protein
VTSAGRSGVATGRAEAGEHALRVGRTGFITLVTALKPFGQWRLRALFAVTSRFPVLLSIAPMQAVHFLHWNLLTHIPYNGPPQIPERPRHPYLIWGTVFNGVEDPYVEGFVIHVPRRIRLIWGSSFGFPGVHSVAGLAHYIADLSWPGGYSYFAYPEATVRDVQSAMAIRREHAFLREAVLTSKSDDFARTYRGFLKRCQGDL